MRYGQVGRIFFFATARAELLRFGALAIAPGRLGSEAHRSAGCGGRGPYGPGRGRGVIRTVSGLAPGAFEFRYMRLLEWDLCLVAPEGLEVRDPAGLNAWRVPVPGSAPGAVGNRAG